MKRKLCEKNIKKIWVKYAKVTSQFKATDKQDEEFRINNRNCKELDYARLY